MSSRAIVLSKKNSRVRRTRSPRKSAGNNFDRVVSSQVANPFQRAPARLTGSTGLPERLTVNIGYNEQFTAAPSSGSSDGYVFALQSCYDPRFAAGGHQPQYFDQLMAIWQYFIVKKVRIRLTITPDADPLTSGTSASASVYQGSGIIAPFLNDTGTRASSAASDMLEWPGAVTRPVMTNGAPAILTLEIDLPKMMGMPANFYRYSTAFWGAAGGNPATSLLYVFVGGIAQGAGAPAPMLCQATLEYHVEFFGVRNLATS